MGYYTAFTLSIENKGNFDLKDLVKKLKEDCEHAQSAFDDDGNDSDDIKWYEHVEDLCAFSLKHPEVVFKLHGEGEETGDLWDKYFQNGKYQLCLAEIIYPPFDPSKLV